MTKNLNTADHLVKLALAVLTTVSYFTDLITGPLAVVLMSLSVVGLFIYGIKTFISIKDEAE